VTLLPLRVQTAALCPAHRSLALGLLLLLLLLLFLCFDAVHLPRLLSPHEHGAAPEIESSPHSHSCCAAQQQSYQPLRDNARPHNSRHQQQHIGGNQGGQPQLQVRDHQ
jgi:hypothetical protein